VLITFAHAQDPATPLLEVLDVGRSLDRWSEEQLAELVARARPVSGPKEPEDIFSDTRARRKPIAEGRPLQ
jgi:hypothetical protein